MLKKPDIEAGLGQTSVVVTQDFVTQGRKFLRCEMVLGSDLGCSPKSCVLEAVPILVLFGRN